MAGAFFGGLVGKLSWMAGGTRSRHGVVVRGGCTGSQGPLLVSGWCVIDFRVRWVAGLVDDRRGVCGVCVAGGNGANKVGGGTARRAGARWPVCPCCSRSTTSG